MSALNNLTYACTARTFLSCCLALFLLATSCSAFSCRPISRRTCALIKSGFNRQCSRSDMATLRFYALVEQDEQTEEIDECPPGYYLDSANERCNKLGPLGTVSQKIERADPFRLLSRKISSLFGVDPKRISNLGVAFAVSYAIISNLNGSISLSMAWYMSCQRTGLSPLAPGQWKSLLVSYGKIYAIIQLLRPFRVAAAIAMSKLTGEFLDVTQRRLGCSRPLAIIVQCWLGAVAWLFLSGAGITLASWASGVPIWSRAT